MATFKNISSRDGVKKWSVVFDLPGHQTRKQKRLSGFNSRQQAYNAHVTFLANYKPPNVKTPVAGTFGGVYSTYIEHVKFGVKETSFLSIEAAFRNHILPYFQDKAIADIKPPNVTEWLLSLGSDKPLSCKSKNKYKGFLSRFFMFCVDNELISANPCDKALKIKNTEFDKEMLIWSEKEFTQFIAAIDKDILYKTLFSFLYLTGVRRGEALALLWNDIQGNIVRINKTLSFQSLKGGYTITTPKNRYSNRDVILPDNLISLLAQLKKEYSKYEIFLENGYVFGNVRPLPQNTIRRKLASYCEKSGVKLIRIHDFRHSHASLLISKGQDIVTIARRLGHADIEMTLNRYAHLMPNKQAELMSSLNISL